MKLTFDEICSLTFGAVRIHEEEDGIHFEKCTENEAASWIGFRPDKPRIPYATTGIRLDFKTDSEFLRFTASNGKKFELLLNGLHYRNYNRLGEEYTIRIDLPEGENRVTLVFPSHTVGVLKSVELSDGAAFEPWKHDRKFRFLGDSITQGARSDNDSDSFAWQVTLAYNADSEITGLGGGIFMTGTIERTEFEPDTVLVAYGTNDTKRRDSFEAYKDGVEQTLSHIRALYPKSRIVVISPTWRADGEAVFRVGVPVDTCLRAVLEIARKMGFDVIDGYALVPHDTTLYADKRLHPNSAGFAYYSWNLIRELKKIGI
ncbi:MAG: SGNH/GDSL hydrolase family protein [Lachnospiraceae bacterium]|nr:SGNH/GDSL hydrolase family protein [Lachnospiraceae bacterium]